MSSVKFCEKRLDICNYMVNYWNNYSREVYVISLSEKEHKKLEEKENYWKLTKVCSLNVKIIVKEYFTSDGFSVEYVMKQRDTFLVEVPDRSSATLMSKTHQNIDKGLTIYSVCWLAYNTLQDNGY